MSGTRAIVVGAGIGGLTAAIALRRVGIDVTVLERARELKQIQLGTGLHIFPNAMHGFRQLDLDTRVAAAGVSVERLQFRTSEGKLMSDIPMGEVCRRLGAPCIGVRRTHLHRVLLEAQGEVPLRMGAEVSSFTQNADGVVVRLADGGEERADLLIGADGGNSAVRAQLLGKEPLLYHGYTSWLGLVEFKHQAAPQELLTVVWGRGGRFIFYHLEPGRLGWIGNLDAPEGEKVPEGQRKRVVRDFFGRWMEPVPSLIEATDERALIKMDLVDRDPVSRWGEGRVTLLGDAAHPMTPNIAQGACQAVEDAVELMKALQTPRDVSASLRAYERSRMARTGPLVKRARMLGTLGQWQNPLICAIRNRFISTFSGVIMKLDERMLSYRP